MKVILCLLLAFGAQSALAQFVPDPAGVHFLKMVLSDDYRKALDGGLTGIDWHIPKSTEKVTAFSLSRAYRQDPEAANERFTGKWITVGGQAVSMGVDPDGKPYVEYGVSNESVQNVHARFDTTSDFMRGQVEWVICKAAGTQGAAPLLEHCIFKYPTTEHGYITPEIDSAINRWFKTGEAPWFAVKDKDRATLFVFYWADRKIFPSAQCATNPSGEACAAAIEAVLSKLNDYPDFGPSYTEARAALRLPALRPQGTTK